MEKILDLLRYTFSVFSDFWNFQVVGDEQNSITLGAIILGVILFLSGYFFCRYLSKNIEKKLLSHSNIEPAIIHNLRNIIFYILLICLFLLVLRFLNIPLTVFTLLGGAFAVGIGFGSQHIVNNFISGLVIMIEQPIKVGDIIQVDNLQGTVEQIGGRGTKIKAVDNTHIIVPNSSFLEKNLYNWTLYDNVVRSQIKIGIAYGSETRRAEALIKQSVEEQEQVLKYPEPKVIFDDFGPDSLCFTVYFWAKAPNLMVLLDIKSTIRFRIDELLREQKIIIAFPQRDVHLDTIKPLQVELLSNKSNQPRGMDHES